MAKLYFKVESDVDRVIQLREEINRLKATLSGMDGNTPPATLHAMEVQLGKNTKELDTLITTAAKAGNEIENGFKKKIFNASQAVNGFTAKIIAQKAVVKDIEADVRRLGEAYHISLKRNPLSSSNKLEEYTAVKKALNEEKAALFGLTQEQANARLSVKKLRDEYALYKNDGKQVIETNKGIGLSLGKALGVIGGVAALKQLGSEIIRVRGEFQSMQTAIETMVGKNMAGQLIPQIKELAKISPLTMSDMVGAEKMMLGFNIQAEDTIKYLKAISDISMGDSGKFNSLTLAFSQMSAAGKLMGQDLNQMINAGFNPLQIIAEKTGKSIAQLKDEMSKGAVSAEMVQQAFIDATSAGGKFFGMSENASKTINGQISMMQDALDNAFNEMGQKSEGVIMKGIQMTTSLIQNYETIGKVLTGLIATYGAYRTAVMLVSASESKHTLVEIGLTNARILARKAQLALNASMLANPYVAVTTLVIGLVAAMLVLCDSTTAAEKAQKQLNKEHEEAVQRKQELTSKTEGLISKINSETESVYSQIKAYKELIKLFPELGNMTFEEFKAMPQSQQKTMLNKIEDKRELEDAIKAYESDLKKIEILKKQINEASQKIAENDSKYSVDTPNKSIEYLNEQLKLTQQLAEGHKKQIEEIKRLQWEANTPVEEKVKHYQDIQARLEKERDELNLQLNPSKVLRSYAEEMADSWLNAKNTIANIKLDALNKQIDETSQKINSLTGKGEGSMLIVNKNKAYWEKQKKEAETALEAIDSKQKRLMDTGNFKGIDSKIVEKYKEQSKLFKEAEKELKVYDSSSKQENETAKRLKAQQDLSRSILDSELKLQSQRIAIMQDGKDKRVLLADQEYKETLATIQKEREEYQKKINESKGKEDPAVLQTFTDREGLAKNKRDTDVAKITREYSDQMKAIQNEVDSHFRSQLDNRLIEIDNYYKEQIKKAKEAGETEEGDFIQMLINKRDAEEEYARKESALSGVDFKEQVDLGNLSNSSGAYFAEETERQKTEILKKYALERIAILESLGDEQSRKESELLKIAVEGYNKALSKPSKKSINTLVDEKAIKALQKHFMNLGASEEEAKKKAESFAETFQGKMQTVSEVTGLLKDVFGGISEELDMALDAIGNIAKGFAEGGLIGGISAAAGQLISVVSNLFTAKREIDKSMVEGYEAYMGAINELIDTQVALLDKLGGMAFGQNIIDTTKDIAKSIAASRTLFNEAMRAGSGVFSHSDGYKANKMLKGYARELREVGIYTTDLNRMTNEQLAALKKLPEVYARLPEGLRKYIDAIAEGLDKTEEFKEQIQDTVLGLDFTSIADMIVNSITDPSIDNALEEFEANIDKTIASIVQNMLRRNMLLGPLEKMTADLYKSMEKKDKNGNTYYKLTADAARDFKENVLGLGKQFDNAWKELEEAFRASGIDLMPKKEEVETDASDNSLKGAYAKASEESIGLLAGQFGAIRVILEEMKNSMVPIREQMQLIYALQTKGWEDVRAIRELTNKVEKNTDKITEIAERLEDTVGEISKDTRRSADVLDGGTINTKIRM